MDQAEDQKIAEHKREPSRRNWCSFISLLLMQTQNAFNDKAVQFLLICTAGALLHKEFVETGLVQGMPYILGGLIVTPFILLAPLAGWIGDRFAKSTIIRFSSVLQAAIFVLLFCGVLMKSLNFLVLCFLLLAIQSAVLSPSKLGVIKELVGRRRLGYASGMLEMFTILGILGGTIIMSHWYGARLASPLSAWDALKLPMLVLLCFTPLAIFGAFTMEKTKSKLEAPFRFSLLFEHFHQVGGLLRRRKLRLSALAVCYFWVFGGYLQLLSYQIAEQVSGKLAAGVGPNLANMMLVAGVGIALGSIAASLVSKRRIELGLVPIGGGMMSVTCFAMANSELLSFWFMLWMFLSGIGAAFFLVPVNAFLQDECAESERANILAASNLLNCLGGILAVASQGILFKYFGLSVQLQFLVLGLVSIGATIYATRLLPQQFVRFVLLMLVRIVYRIRIEKDGNMPRSGGLLLVSNHVSYIDAFIISAASPRPIRFLMFDEYFKKPWMVWFLKLFNTVPISRNRAKQAIQIAADAIASGDVVCIFPEGQLTRTGSINEVKRGFEMIARKAKCPIQAAYMDGLWGSIFSFERGKFLRKIPYRLQYGVTVVFDEVVPATEATNLDLRHRFTKLGAKALAMRNQVLQTQKWAHKHPKIRAGKKEFVQNAGMSFAKSSITQQQKWVLNALQIADSPAILRGSVVVIDASVASLAGEVLLHTLPILNKNHLVVWDQTFGQEKLQAAIKTYQISLAIGGEEFKKQLAEASFQGIFYNLEAEISLNGEFSWWIVDGRILSINMEHPNAITATQQFQAGTKEGSLGRLLPGFYIDANSIKDGLGNQINFKGVVDTSLFLSNQVE